MANALIFVASDTSGPNLSARLDACAALASQNLIVVMCADAVRNLAQAELDALAAVSANVILSPSEPRGEACSALLASEWIDGDSELVVADANAGRIDLVAMSAYFRGANYDAGLANEAQANVRLDHRGHVIEVVHKKPGAAEPHAGAYWFAHGRDFLRAIQAMIRKNPNHSGRYDICPAFNELVLENRAIGVYPLGAEGA